MKQTNGIFEPALLCEMNYFITTEERKKREREKNGTERKEEEQKSKMKRRNRRIKRKKIQNNKKVNTPNAKNRLKSPPVPLSSEVPRVIIQQFLLKRRKTCMKI